MENEEIVIDIEGYLLYLRKNLLKIVIVTVLFGAISGIYTHFFIHEMYESNARLFLKPEVSEGTVDSTNMYSNGYMIANYVEMIKGNNIQTKVANNLNYKVGVISKALDVTSVTSTQIISITATTTDASLSKKIVDETVDVFISEMDETFGITNICVVDEATKAKEPVSPNLKKNIIYAAFAGALLMFGFYTVLFLMDNKIHNSDEAEKFLGIPSLGAIPYFEDLE